MPKPSCPAWMTDTLRTATPGCNYARQVTCRCLGWEGCRCVRCSAKPAAHLWAAVLLALGDWSAKALLQLHTKLRCDDTALLEHTEQLLAELGPGEGAAGSDDDEPPLDNIEDDFVQSSDEEDAMEH
ncbi:putative assembly chaperone of rpl4 [Arapaima gigas]